jgi:hypothetical protein
MRTKKTTRELNTWEVTPLHVSFTLPNGNQYYHIEMGRLDDIRVKETYYGITFTNVSTWIAHLQGYVWIEKRHLFELAKIIQDRRQNNKIDWEQTFWMIEVKSQLKNLHRSMEANNEFEHASKGEDTLTATTGDQMHRNGEKFLKQVKIYIAEHQLDKPPLSI